MAEIFGSTTPRIYTPPLVTGPPGPCGCGCALTPETSYGFRVVEFAEKTLRRRPWPWQRWVSIHAGELRPDGIPRFRRIILEVGRQSGKTREVEDLTLYWIFEERQPSILGTSTLTKYAKKPWKSAFNLALKTPSLRARMGENPERKAIRLAAGEEEWWTEDGCHYAIAASNAEGGRSMSNTRVIADEFAKQYNYDAYGAAYYSMDAFEDAQYWALTTPDPKGEPYNDLRSSALRFIEHGEGDPSLGLFSWSSPQGSDPTDLRALAMSNPTLGYPGGKSAERLLNEAKSAVTTGGLLLYTFKTEVMCIQEGRLDVAIDPVAWKRCADPAPITARSRVALVIDVAQDSRHATAYAAVQLPDGRVRIDFVKDWTGDGCVAELERDLPELEKRIKPKLTGWIPNGPAASIMVPMRLASATEIRGEVSAVCMGFAELVAAGKIAHGDDPLLNSQVNEAEKLRRGNVWVFSHGDALYAAAGAVHLARTIPQRTRRTGIVVA